HGFLKFVPTTQRALSGNCTPCLPNPTEEGCRSFIEKSLVLPGESGNGWSDGALRFPAIHPVSTASHRLTNGREQIPFEICSSMRNSLDSPDYAIGVMEGNGSFAPCPCFFGIMTGFRTRQ